MSHFPNTLFIHNIVSYKQRKMDYFKTENMYLRLKHVNQNKNSDCQTIRAALLSKWRIELIIKTFLPSQ